jgi:hypothetical protein
MEQHENARFSGVWTKAADRRYVGLCWKYFGLQEWTASIDCGCGKQPRADVVFCLFKVSEVASHLNPGSAVAKQTGLKLTGEPAQDLLGCLRVPIKASTRVIF